MIKTVADLLKAFADEEREKLDQEKIAHGPTIGDMYEGLTREILSRTIPEELGLRVVRGFAYFGEQVSGEIDCMLVRGQGERISFTDKYRWPIKDVLAVFEVKKRLGEEDLACSYFHLRKVLDLYSSYVESDEAQGIKFNIRGPQRIFAQITGIAAPAHNQVGRLPFDLEMIYHILIMEFLSPTRIVVGHHGWKKEKTLRDHIWGLLKKRLVNPVGMGVGSFPQLIIGGRYSLVKANGFPYTVPMLNGMWPFLLSTRHNPIRIMLEMIWSRLDYFFGLGDIWSDGVEEEVLNPCLSTKAVTVGGRSGWEYIYHPYKEKTLSTQGDVRNWQPTELNDGQFSVISRLCKGVVVSAIDQDFIDFAEKKTGSVDSFVENLLSTHLVARKGDEIVLTTMECQVVFFEGKCFAAENNAHQLTRWLEAKKDKPIEDWSTLIVRTFEDDKKQ